MSHNKAIVYKKFPDSNSIVDQESFVLNITQEKRNGYYVEIGAFHSKVYSNTFLLETIYDWKGIALDVKENVIEEYNSNRKNPCVLANGADFNFDEYFLQNNFPKQIDFLQIDVENYEEKEAIKTLINIPFGRYRFSVICFEHDNMMSWKNEEIKILSRDILTTLGYELVVREHNEDFWVDPKAIDKSIWHPLIGRHERRSEYNKITR